MPNLVGMRKDSSSQKCQPKPLRLPASFTVGTNSTSCSICLGTHVPHATPFAGNVGELQRRSARGTVWVGVRTNVEQLRADTGVKDDARTVPHETDHRRGWNVLAAAGRKTTWP